MADWIISLPAARCEEAVRLAAERVALGGRPPCALRRLATYYGRHLDAMARKREEIANAIKKAFKFYRTASAQEKPEEKCEVAFGLSIVARMMEVFGYSRAEAMAERLDVAIALLQTRAAMAGKLKIIGEAQARLMDQMAAAEAAAANG